LVVNVTTIIAKADKAFRVALAVELRVLNRFLDIDTRLDWIVNGAHLTLCAAAHTSKSSCDGAWWGRGGTLNASGPSTVLVRGWGALSLLSNHRETLVPTPRFNCCQRNLEWQGDQQGRSGVWESHFLVYFGPCRGFTSAVPSGLDGICRRYPGLASWAKISRPFGTDFGNESSHTHCEVPRGC